MARLANSLEAENPLQPLLDQHRRYVAALRAGGFVCFLPGLVDPTWDDMARRLAGFAMNISFSSLPHDIERQALPFMLTTAYWIQPATCHLTEELRTVRYRSRPANPYWLEVSHDRRTGLWTGRKFRADQLLVEATGRDTWPFVIQFTMGGRAADEPALAWQTCEDAGAHRVYVWTPVTGEPPLTATDRDAQW